MHYRYNYKVFHNGLKYNTNHKYSIIQSRKKIGTNCSLFAQLNYKYFISALATVNFKNSFGLFLKYNW